ncbi:MAG TPA: hypothetical protein VJO34_08430 [Methylomirabilota bacterium]|nr:hypothetical protein [Methylomirabilota bacterium]
MARGLEAEWEKHLQEINAAQAELARREKKRPLVRSPPRNGVDAALAGSYPVPSLTHEIC